MRVTAMRTVGAVLALLGLAGGAAWAQMYNEAPMLAAMVRAGELPPVDERLPANPLVVEPFDSIGTYGGTLRMMDVSDRMSIGLRVRHTGLFRYNQTASAFEPDLAESHAWSNNNRTLTLKLREGLRWSDGEPFTTADMLFKWEQDMLNEDLTSSLDPFYTLGGERAVWEAIDDSTLSITWAAPNPVAMDRYGRTHFSGDNVLFLPAHYMEQFHAGFNDDAAALAAEKGYEDWQQMFRAHGTQGYTQSAVIIGRPYLDMHTPEVVESDRVQLVRNPYYHHVDTANNQLPYIDRFEVRHVGDLDLYDLKASAGEVDFAAYYTSAPSLPTYRAGEQQGDYQTIIAQSLRTAELVLFLNQNIEDPVLNELFGNLDFRVGLSVALNRPQMNDIVFFGHGRRASGDAAEHHGVLRSRLVQRQPVLRSGARQPAARLGGPDRPRRRRLPPAPRRRQPAQPGDRDRRAGGSEAGDLRADRQRLAAGGRRRRLQGDRRCAAQGTAGHQPDGDLDLAPGAHHAARPRHTRPVRVRTLRRQ